MDSGRSPLATRTATIWSTCVSIALTLLAVAYLTRGFTVTIGSGTRSGDLERRWIEQQYIFAGQNPYDVAFEQRRRAGGLTGGVPPPRESGVMAEVGVPWDVDYPPWAYFTACAFFWPDRSSTPYWFAGWQAMSLVIVLRWVCRATPTTGLALRVLPLGAIAAFGSICTTVGTGNYGVIVLACLTLSLEFGERNWHLASGIALGVALLKPNLSGLFVLIPLLCVDVLAIIAAVHDWPSQALRYGG